MPEGRSSNGEETNKQSKRRPPPVVVVPANWKSCFREDLFRGKVALVTGGGTGIGRSIATELALLGATVVIASRKHETCAAAAREINGFLAANSNAGKSGGRVVAGPSTNIRKEEEIRNLVGTTIENHGSLDLLVCNSGGQFIQETAEISSRGFSAVTDTNLRGTFLCMREAYNQHMRDHGGSIVNITLINRNGLPMMAHSAAARAGVENLVASLSTEWIESDVRVNCVRPGIIFTDSGFENYGPAGDYFLERMNRSLPARRLGSPQEVSSAVTWLLSEGASYVTGVTLCVDGAGSYIGLPMVDTEDTAHLLPVYGSLPPIARL